MNLSFRYNATRQVNDQHAAAQQTAFMAASRATPTIDLFMLGEAMRTVSPQALAHALGSALARMFDGELASAVGDGIVRRIQMVRRGQP